MFRIIGLTIQRDLDLGGVFGFRSEYGLGLPIHARFDTVLSRVRAWSLGFGLLSLHTFARIAGTPLILADLQA